jgi:biopolymer transport protein ExbD
LEILQARLVEDYQDPEQVVRISAEDIVPLQKIINLMDSIRKAGFEKIFVATGVEQE